MFKKLILFLLLFVILAVTGVTLYFNLLDWNEHKAVIAKQFAETTGKKIDFNGAVSFKLFPSPSLEASSVEIYDNDEKNNKILLAKIRKLVASLSFRSLLQRRFNIENMTMVKPEIFVDIFDDGRLNWQMTDGANMQDFTVKNVDVSFGSVVIDGAKVSVVDKKHDVDLLFDDVNAEVAAGSFFGPYRIEGSYIKNGDTRGFAFDLGKFSESFATSVNVVITHPQSESYVRFDGTVMIKNEAVNGNLVVESKNPINFLHSMYSDINVSEKYEYPLAMSLAVKSDKEKISFSNVVIKYADSAGAGNIFIPRQKERAIGESDDSRRRIETAFNFTDLNMDLMVDAIRDFLHSYDEEEYSPNVDFDVIADFKALKANYKGQAIRDVDVSIDFVNNVLSLQNLSAGFPFEGTARMKGEMFSKEKVLNYTYDVEMETLNFAQSAIWLGLDLQPISKNIYKRAAAKFTIEGNPKTIKFSPFVMNLDKTTVDAKLAVVRGDKDRYFAIVNADNISFDNYVAPLPEEMKDESWKNKVDYFVKKMGRLNDVDLQIKADLKSGIWQRTPFEKAHLEATLKDGVMKITKFYTDELASSQIEMRGDISGFGSALQFKNLRYNIDVDNMPAFVDKFGINMPEVNWKNLPVFSSSGVMTGDFDRFAIKSESKLGNIRLNYEGEVNKQDSVFLFDGKLGVQADDAVKMLHDISIDYNPLYPLGMLKFYANIKTNPTVCLFKEMNLNVGANNFAGDILFSKNEEGKRLLKANLNVNKFEFERFLYDTNQKEDSGLFRTTKESVPFLIKPEFSKVKINYDFMKDVDVEAKLNVLNLSYKNFHLKNASWAMFIKNQILKVTQFVAERGGGVVNTDFVLDVPNQSLLSGNLSLNNVRVKKDAWNGLVYGLNDGFVTLNMDFNTDAASFYDMLNKISGSGNIIIENPEIKGWNFGPIYDDLETRKSADGIKPFIQINLAKGVTNFDSLKSEFSLDNGAFNFKDAVFAAQEYDISANIKGNLDSWTLGAEFAANVKNVSRPSQFSFVMDGDLNAPSLDVDVSKLSGFYENKIKKKTEEVKAIEDARINKYKSLLSEQHQRALGIKENLQKNILPKFKFCNERAENQKIKSYYDEIYQRIVRQNSLINEVVSKSEKLTFNDQTIEELKKSNNEIAAELPKIIEDMNFVHDQDVRMRVNERYMDAVSKTSNLQRYSPAILDVEGAIGERLAEINTAYSIEKDKKAGEYKQKMDAIINEIKDCAEYAKQELNNIKKEKDLDVWEKTADDLKTKSDYMEAKRKELASTFEEYKDYLDKRVTAEENKYNKKTEEKEVVEEKDSVGKISTAGGKTRVIKFSTE